MNTAGQISWTCQKAARSCLRQTVAELKYIDENHLITDSFTQPSYNAR